MAKVTHPIIQKIRAVYKSWSHWLNFQPPGALSSDAWNLFNIEFKEKAPIRYFFARNFQSMFVWPIRHKWRQIDYCLYVRLISRRHIVRTGLKPGYIDAPERMLYANFAILVDAIEKEMGSSVFLQDIEEISFWERYVPYYNNWFPELKKQRGLARLKADSEMDDPSLHPSHRDPIRAAQARELTELYKWWLARPSRMPLPDLQLPRDADGKVDRLCPEYKEWRTRNSEIDAQADAWSIEDGVMLERLVKARLSLYN
jgi:hypothetical protein